jgi:outer membrane protein
MKPSYVLITVLLLAQCPSMLAQSPGVPGELSGLYQLTITKSPTLQRQHILSRRAVVEKQFARSLFDYQLFSNLGLNQTGNNLFEADPRNKIVDRLNANSLNFSSGLQRLFRSGLTARVDVNYARLADNFPFNAFNENVGAFFGNNTSNTRLSLTQPLLRGRGRNIVTANETIAEVGVKSQEYNAIFVASNEVLNMALGYWQYLGAQKSLGIYRENQERVRKVLEITNELVKADKKPSSDLLQVQADLKDKEQQTIQAEQGLYNARQNLGRYIGLNSTESESIGQAMNDFPLVQSSDNHPTLAQLLNIARQNRADLKAMKKSLEGAGVNVAVAENQLRPQVDLTVYAGYGGQAFGNGMGQFFNALGNQQGRNHLLGMGINFMFPVQDQEVQIGNQIRNIELNVSIAHNNYLNSIAALNKAKESLDYYTQVFGNEQAKFQQGLTTLLNLILFQERLTFAQLAYIQSQQQYAMAISSLRFETGTLFSFEQASGAVTPSLDLILTLPKE